MTYLSLFVNKYHYFEELVPTPIPLQQRLLKKPRSIEFVPQLPKNAYGKILKWELRERHWQGQQHRI
jgi:acyl-CoA synthetase (AMP-forming)/AMP-acid ligase II